VTAKSCAEPGSKWSCRQSEQKFRQC